MIRVADIIDNKRPRLLERQKELTKFALNSFPAIRELVKKDEN